MSVISLGSSLLSWTLVALLTQPGMSTTSSCVSNSRLGTVADTKPPQAV